MIVVFTSTFATRKVPSTAALDHSLEKIVVLRLSDCPFLIFLDSILCRIPGFTVNYRRHIHEKWLVYSASLLSLGTYPFPIMPTAVIRLICENIPYCN